MAGRAGELLPPYRLGTGSGFVNLLREQQGRAEELLPDTTSFAARHRQIPMWRVVAAGYQVTLKRAEEARRKLEGLAANDFADVPRDLMWLYTMSRLSDVVSFVGDVRRAALLYDLLLPYADRCAVAGGTLICRGAVSRSLGVLATLLSRYEEAERHFEKALEVNARTRARASGLPIPSTTTRACWWGATGPATGSGRRRSPGRRSSPRARWA
jgi:tetratricopeptide (TPR) repeat protein